MTTGKDLHGRLIQEIRFADGHAEIWRVFENGSLFREVVDALAEPWARFQPTKVAGIEARGFILGAAVAQSLGTGFVAIRKEGPLLAGRKVQMVTGEDYQGREQRLQLRQDSLSPDDRVLLIDDWCETGSQATAAMRLIESCSAAFLGFCVIVDELPPNAAIDFPRYSSLVRGDELQNNAEAPRQRRGRWSAPAG